MSKYLKLYTSVKLDLGSKNTRRPASLKQVITKALPLVALLITVFIAVLASYSEPVFFKNIVVGLFIVGSILLIKAIGEEKTRINRIKK